MSANENVVSATAQVIDFGELRPTAGQGGAGSSVLSSANPLHSVRVSLGVHVGSVEMSIGELLAAKAQQVFVLDQGLEEPVDLVLEGKVVARGQLVAVDGKFAVRILELPIPLKP